MKLAIKVQAALQLISTTSSPSHGYIDGSDSIDPRGESYYSMDYGDAKIISLNLNGDDFSPLCSRFSTNDMAG